MQEKFCTGSEKKPQQSGNIAGQLTTPVEKIKEFKFKERMLNKKTIKYIIYILHNSIIEKMKYNYQH